MVYTTFHLHDGSVIDNNTDLDATHPIFSTGFVTDLMETHEDEDGELTIPLPAFIGREEFVLICNHLRHYKLSNELVGFGKHSNLTYSQVNRDQPGYISWARGQEAPNGRLAELLDWINDIDTIPETWRERRQQMLRIAKYFRVDVCSNCGILGTEHIRLAPCHRTSWPNISNIPAWDEVTRDIPDNDHSGHSRAWREAWEAADRDRVASGRTVCLNDDLLCSGCTRRSTLACRDCGSWECEQCQQDTEASTILEQWHERDPRVEEDWYGRRGPSPYQDLKARPCLVCRKRVCHQCGSECYECHRRACSNCKNADDLKSWCGRCRFAIEENGDDAIGPQDRDEWICRSCFDSEPHECGCGEPSYDPNASASDSNASESENEEYWEDPAPLA